MTETSLAGATVPATQPALVYTREPIKATWTETFYDGEVKVVEGRIERYKENWLFELCANRGFSIEEPEPTASSVAENASVAKAAEKHSLISGQDVATPKPKTTKKVKGKN